MKKCSIALGINSGERTADVSSFGAKAIVSGAKSFVNPRNLDVKSIAPDVFGLNGLPAINKGASYIFSNTSPVTQAGLISLGVFQDEDVMQELIAAGSNLYKDISDDFFSSIPGKVINPVSGLDAQIIFEGDITGDNKTFGREFITISPASIKKARAIVDAEFGQEDEAVSAISKQELYDEGMEFLIISALYRGYDIAISGPVNKNIVKNAITRYNKIKPTGKKIVYGSTSRGDSDIKKVTSIDTFISDTDSQRVSTKQIHNTNLVLNTLIGEDERTTYDLARSPSLTTKLVVASRIIDVFKTMMPNVTIKLLGSNEIENTYGHTFAQKKNFIIDNTIILNIDTFTPATLFHEFGHYYSRWLSQYNQGAFEVLLDTVKNHYKQRIPGYTSLYNSTGIHHSEEAILEEIFVDELGMLAAKDLEAVLDQVAPEDSELLAHTVDTFAQEFLRKLTKNVRLNIEDTVFDINSSIADIFNIGMQYSRALNPTNMLSYDSDSLNHFRDFLIQKASPKDVFQGLINRSLIRHINKDTIVLLDYNGNIVDLDGNTNSKASYKYYPWTTADNIKKNKDLIEKADGYLDRNKHMASVRFSLSQTPASVKDIIRNNSFNLSLTDSSEHYKKDGEPLLYERVTHYLDEQFSNKKEADAYILNSMYTELMQENIFSISKGSPLTPEITTAAYEATSKVMEDRESAAFRSRYNAIASKFAFKTSEGTYLHNLAEFFFRALNYSQTIDYKTKVENRSPTYFIDRVKEGIAAKNAEEFTKYFETHFFNHLKGQEGTTEYMAFKDGFEFLLGAMGDRSVSKAPATVFLDMIIKDVLPIINNVPGPITIMPEVRLSSKNMKLAGTIDLLIIDGKGFAHIFDYKTKEVGKEVFWDWRQGTSMKGVMGAYHENAMMKASIQTSIYKLMLMELGVQVGQANIFYVESKLPKAIEYATYDTLLEDEIEALKGPGNHENVTLRYTPVAIKRKGVYDVSAELLSHLKESGRAPELAFNATAAQDITETLLKAAGGRNIDLPDDVTRKATYIYDGATRRKHGVSGDPRKQDLIERATAAYLNKAKGATGLEVVLPGGNKHTLSPKLNGKREESVAAIAELIKGKEHIRALESDLLTLFDRQNRDIFTQAGVLATKDTEIGLRPLIRGADFTSHEMTRLSSNASFGIDYSGILMLKNKVTGETRMIIINPEDNDDVIPFGSRDRNNLFGAYVTNGGLRAILPEQEWLNNTHNMRLIKAGLVMIQQKQLDKDFSVNTVISNSGLSRTSIIPNLHDTATILLLTKTMLKLMKDNGEVLPASLLSALERPELFESRSYVKNPIESLTDHLTMITGDYVRLDDMFKEGSAKASKEAIKKILDNYNPNQDTLVLEEALHNFRNSLSLKMRDVETRVHNDLWTLTDQIIMHLKGFNYTINPKNTGWIANMMYTTSRMPNKYGASFNRKISESTINIREDFMEYKNQHSKLLKALAESQGVSLSGLSSARFKSSMKGVYKNLYTTDNTDRTNAFILKSPEQVSTQAEKDYLIFLRKTYQKYGEMASFTKPVIPFGWMPIIHKSNQGIVSDEGRIKNLRKLLKGFNFNGPMQEGDPRGTIDKEFSVESKFAAQLPVETSTAYDQYTRGRQRLLSLDPSGMPTPKADDFPISNLEDNLENATDAYVLASLDALHYKDVSEFGRSLYYTVLRHEYLSHLNFGPVIETISLIQRRVINHEESDGGNKTIKSINSFATNAAIAGTVSQALLETFTNPLVTSANFMADKLYGAMFSGTREFSLASYSEAFKLVALPADHKIKKTIEAISNTYGITASDTATLKQQMNLLESKFLFQSDNLMYVNKLMMESWQKITMVAFMIEQGSFYAHTVNDDGDLIYDEKKDKRFHFYLGAASPDYADKKKFYDATKLELAKQKKGLNNADTYDKKTLRKAWTSYDANYVKEKVVELYSSLDDTSKSLATYYTYMGFVLKMRTWLFSKTARYFQPPMTAEEGESASKLVRVKTDDGDYRYEWKGEDTEGIVFTLYAMLKQVHEYRTDVLTKGSLTDRQKKNLSYLVSDAFIWTFMGAAATGIFKYILDEEDRKDETVQLLYKRWIMATGDVFVPASIFDMVSGNGSMMIGLAVFRNFLTSAIDVGVIAPQVLVNPDVPVEDLYSASKTMMVNAYGPFKSVETISKMFSSEE